MMYPLPNDVTTLGAQPVESIEEVAGIYFRSVLLEQAGTVIPQHIHDHAHATLCGSGKARVWVNGKWLADLSAGHAVEIRAGQEHVFLALEPNTRLVCVHDVESALSVKQKF